MDTRLAGWQVYLKEKVNNTKVTQLSVAGPGEESKCSAKNIDPNIDTSTKVLMDIINEKDKLLIEKEKELHKLLIYEKEFGKQLNTFSMDFKKDKENTLNKEKELENQIVKLKLKVQMDQEKMLTQEKENKNKRKAEAFIDKRNKNKKTSQDMSTKIVGAARGVLPVGFINKNSTNARKLIFG